MSVMQFTSPAPVEGQGYGINWALQDLEIEEMNALLS